MYSAIDRGELWGNSFVFDPNEMQWVELNHLGLFKKLGLSFKNSLENFKKPKRIPASQQSKETNPEKNLKEMETHYLEDYISVFQNQIDKLLSNNLQLVDENIEFKVKNSESKAEFEMLKFQNQLEVQKLTNECESLRKDLKDHVQVVEEQREELRKLRSDYQKKLEDQHSKLTKLFTIQSDLMEKNNSLAEQYKVKAKQLENLTIELETSKKEARDLKKTFEGSLADRETELLNQVKSWKQKYNTDLSAVKSKHETETRELNLQIELLEHKLKTSPSQVVQTSDSKLQEVIVQKDQKIKELLAKQKEIAAKYKEDFTKAQKTFENYQQVIHKQKQKEADLNSNVLNLNHNLKQAKDDLELEKNKAQRLEMLMNQQESLNEIADEKVKVQDDFVAFKELGKLFEISNAPHWEVRADVYKGVKFTLKQMREMIQQGELDEESFVRREGKWWKKAKEVHELFLELREREEKGEIHYYIERASLRVPCGDKVELSTDNFDFGGVCVNISTGGCLIQVPDLNTHAFKKNQEITIAFVSESLLFEFEIVGTVRSIDFNDKSLGIQFVDITDEEFDTINFYIDGFAEKVEEEAA